MTALQRVRSTSPRRGGRFAAALAIAAPLFAAQLAVSRETHQSREGETERARAERLLDDADALRRRYELDASRQALALYASALEVWVRLGDGAEAARTHERMGAILEETGAVERALHQYREGLRLAREAGDASLQSGLLSEVGRALVLLGSSEQGLERCEESRQLARATGSVDREAQALDCLGEVAYHRGDLSSALGFHEQALALWRELADRRGEAESLLYLGSVYSDLSELASAERCHTQALTLWRRLGERRGEALTLVALGRLRDRMGDYQAALNAAREAARLVEPMGDLTWQASILFAIGLVYERMGDREPTASYWTRALELFREAGVRVAEVDVLLQLGALHLAGDDAGSALEHLERALALSRELANPRLTTDALTFLGLVHRSRGETREALAEFEQALAVVREGEDRRSEAFILGNMSDVHAELGHLEYAHETGNRSIALSRAARDPLGESLGLYNLARVASARNDLEAARRHVEDSLRLAESLRSGVASHELKSSYLAEIHPRYELLIDLLMRLDRKRPDQGLAGEALKVSERARARSLLESLSEGGIDIQRGIEAGLLDSERSLERLLDSKADLLMRLMSREPDPSRIEALEDEIRALTRQYDQVRAEIRSRSPRYAALTQPRPLDLPAIQQEILDPDTLLLEYALGRERSYLWAVSSTRLTSHELPPRDEIEGAAREVYALLTARLPVPGESLAELRRRTRQADAEYWPAAGRLARLLLEPVADRLAGKRLLVVADGALQYIPFAALPLPGRSEPVPLIAEHEIVHLPSASTLAILRRETAGRQSAAKSVAVLADPVFEADDPRVIETRPPADRQPGAAETTTSVLRALRPVGLAPGGKLAIPRLMATRREAARIVATAPEGSSFAAIGFAASRTTAMSSRLADYRIVHFATHGLIHGDKPELSGILLSMVDERGRPQNGFLRLHDIYNLELPVELVVLSACNSALGKEVRGEGLVGLVRGFMYAGARRTVASLWKVDDEATGELMGRFYLSILRDRRSPAAALRQAQIDMWRHAEWSSPFNWAAFVLQGEWR